MNVKWPIEITFVNKYIFLKRIFKILRYVTGILLALMVSIVLLVNYSPVQNILAKKAAAILSKKLKTKVAIAHVRIDFLNHLLIQGLFIGDHANDTLVYAGEAQIRISDWFLFSKKPVLHYIALRDAYVHLYRPWTSGEWNYEFLSDISESPKDTGKTNPVEFNLEKISLERVRFHMDDHWVGENIDVDVGWLRIDADNLDLKKKRLDVNSITIKESYVSLDEYKGGRPKKTHPIPELAEPVDTTPFNPGKWVVTARQMFLNNCGFKLTADTLTPAPDLFDANHLDITKVNVAANQLSIIGDTIKGKVVYMNARDRCGLAVKNMKSDVSVSPVASICSNLTLETNHSLIKNYYAMLYKRFPDFLEYIDSVVMVGHLKESIIDERDIAYFAPELKKFPPIVVKASGDGRGTVANLAAEHLSVSDGFFTIKGNGTMKGLPDIYKTWITFTNGEVYTSGAGILHYVPGLKSSPEVDMSQIASVAFRGNYEGYVEDFAVSGDLTTNLGSLNAHIKMKMPGFNSKTAVLSGSVATNHLVLGAFLKLPQLGGISMNENIACNSFDPEHMQLNVDGKINEITIKDYAYRNIITKGILAKKQFDGDLLIDDPNLALEFDGDINYSNKDINVKAVAHMLECNFRALNLTKDSLTGSGDFDLNCTGSDIDNFSGYAKLYNISMKRNDHRLALDSVYINSTTEDGQKLLTIESNDVSAQIKGNYELSKIPKSVQYYLSRYIPNYIKAPEELPPGQNLEFSVATINIDSIFAFALPVIRGFDHANLSGSLNTTERLLTLNTEVPYGSVGKLHLNNVNIKGQGNLDRIELNASVESVSLGDSFLNGTLRVNTTVGNDSIDFTIATSTLDTSEAINLNGNVIARKDSLFLSILPSQFFLNQAKWDIAGGSKIVYADQFLDVQKLSLSSGLQHVSAGTELQDNNRSLLINAENLDLGQLGSWAGFSGFQPDGRVNGTIKIAGMFKDLVVSTNIKATGVKLGADTLGTVNIIGEYENAMKMFIIDPQTGIYNNNSTVSASGKISFDSLTHQKIEGSIQFSNADVSWTSIFLAGIMSHLSGAVNGTVNFEGTTTDPVIDGTVRLTNAGFHVDYMGCSYSIPAATIHVDNKRISFGRVLVYDADKNQAVLTGHFSHNLFRNMRMHLTMTSDKFEVMNLSAADNNLFYGNLIAGVDSFTIKGPFNNIDLGIYNAYPAAKSKFYLPVSSGGDLNAYSYVSFKSYGKSQEIKGRKSKEKLNISIDANLNSLAEIHILLDPTSGDEIMAKGDGRLQLEFPPNNDISMRGIYVIDNGLYSFTFKRLGFVRQFNLNSESTITFNGPFSETTLDVNAIYATKARLFDLLTDPEKAAMTGSDLTDAQTAQMVDVILHMDGLLSHPRLTYDLDLEDKHSQSTIAYSKLKLINADDQQKVEEVAALLLIHSFIPSEGIGSGTAITGGINNISQVLSGSMSTGLTNIVNKLTGNKQLNVDVKYENYNYGDQNNIAANRSLVTVGVNKNFLNDRLGVELGSTSDWGRPTSAASTASTFNITGDFRIQYLLSYASGLRLNAFRTSDYDVTLDKDIQRSGVGISWRKSFDNFNDFFAGNKSKEKEKEKMKNDVEAAEDSLGKKVDE